MKMVRFEAWKEDDDEPATFLYINPEAVLGVQLWRNDRVWIYLHGVTMEVRAPDLDTVIRDLERDPNAPVYVFPSGDSTTD